MASKRKATVDNLDDVISDILGDYAGEVRENLDEITAKVTKEGVKALKNESLTEFNDVHLKKGRYGSGWTSTMETGRFSTQGTIYNKKYPGLPHLLEHGHAKRGGGRVPGKVHIAPVEEKIVKSFQKEVLNDLT